MVNRIDISNEKKIGPTGRDLSDLDLSCSRFNKANMKTADFSRSTLKNSSFYKANLTKTRFVESSCNGSDFSRAILNGADFSGADLKSAILAEVRAEKANFSGSSLKKATFNGAVLHDTNFCQADLTGANFKFASLHGAKLKDAILLGADFRYSFGLSYAEITYLQDNGAKISFLWHKIKIFFKFIHHRFWSKLLLVALLIALGSVSFFYFSNPTRKSISILLYKVRVARNKQQYEKALLFNSVVTEKYKQNNELEEVFLRQLDEARFYRLLENKEKSKEVLTHMLNSYSQSPEKISRINLELAFIYKDEGQMTEAVSILENIDFSLNSRTFRYDVRVHLARGYRSLKQYDRAASIFKGIIKAYSDDIWRQYTALRDLNQVYLRKGENEKSENILEYLTWDPQNHLPYFRSLIDLVDMLSARNRYQEAKNICDFILMNIRDNPGLSTEVNDRMKIIRKKIGRTSISKNP